MKVGAVKQAAQDYALEAIDAAIEALTEREEELLAIEGDDLGERLTHLLLARRIRARVEAGEAFKDAFRTEMSTVRETLKNA